ncbi:hypothetical protein ABTE44_19985, partial [Acinetobacter baumannii]
TVDSDGRLPRKRYMLMTGAALGGLVALAVGAAFNPRLALMFMLGATGAFAILRLVAFGVMALAARLPRPRHTGLRLAIAN